MVRDEQDGEETLNFVHDGYVWAVRDVNPVYGTFFPEDMLSLLESGEMERMVAWFNEEGPFRLGSMPDRCRPIAEVKFAPLYRRPRKILGIAPGWVEAGNTSNVMEAGVEPVSFLMPDTAIVGPGEELQIPRLSEQTTAVAELALIIGSECREVAKQDWLSAVAGYTTIIDMTAEDILCRDPRNLTASKSFDTFFSFGPVFVSADEVGDVAALVVKTLLNGEAQAEITLADMPFQPDFLVSYHSQVMTLLAGDVISMGTPGAVALADGDVVGCEIDGVGKTSNPVVDLKRGGSS